MSDVVGLDVAGLTVAPAHAFEMVAPFERDDFGVGSEDDGGILFDATDQIARHGLGKSLRPHEHVHAPGGLCQKHRGLAGGVSAAHHDHFFTAAQLRFHERRAVVHARALELQQVLDGRLPIRGTGCDDDSARRHVQAIVDLNGVGLAVAGELLGAFRDDHLRPEFLRLRIRPRGEILTRDAGRETKVVFDLRARTGLSPGRVGLHHEDVQSFRRGVHGGRESRGSGADDDHVAYLGLVDGVVEAEAVGDLLIGRIPKHHLAATDQQPAHPRR